MQNVYWNKMFRYKYFFFYLQAMYARLVKIDRYLKIGCAIASSAAIASWAKWNNLDFIWGFIIVASQVVTAINEILPYKKRISELSNMLALLSAFFIDVEKRWYDVSSGVMTEAEINELTYEFARRWNEIDSKFFVEDSLPQNIKIKNNAENAADLYMKTQFGGATNE